MSLSGYVRGGFSVLVGLLCLYVLENTFGTAMDSMFLAFHNVVNTIPLSAGWKSTIISVLGGWVWFDKAFVVVIIAMFVWLVSLIFIDLDYGKPRSPGQY